VSSQGRSTINPRNLNNIAKSSGFDLNQFYSRQLFPFKLGFIGVLVNKFLELLLMPFNLGIKYYMVFAPYGSKSDLKTKSIIIPAKNEEKNLVPLIERIPIFEDDYELIVVYGPSQDKTEDVVNKLSETFPNIKIITLKQSKNGKANAVWEAVSIASNDLIAILDSDQSVDPETLTEFFNILESGNADFVNGTRLIYPMEDKAMRALNTYGNKIFQFLISLVIQQKLSDSLCGTKVFKKTNIIKILNWQKTLNSKDPFGDFDLIFSAAYAGDKILEYPVHYRARVYGETQISRFRDGIKLIRYFLESFYYFNISK
jgi:glycosyltransferase involved in cell wall biosynthesis